MIGQQEFLVKICGYHDDMIFVCRWWGAVRCGSKPQTFQTIAFSGIEIMILEEEHWDCHYSLSDFCSVCLLDARVDAVPPKQGKKKKKRYRFSTKVVPYIDAGPSTFGLDAGLGSAMWCGPLNKSFQTCHPHVDNVHSFYFQRSHWSQLIHLSVDQCWYATSDKECTLVSLEKWLRCMES